jgi:hypothetical protein
MNIFSLLKDHEECTCISYPLSGWWLEPRVVPLKKNSVPTSPLDGVTIRLKKHKYFKYLNLNILRAGNILQFCTYSGEPDSIPD